MNRGTEPADCARQSGRSAVARRGSARRVGVAVVVALVVLAPLAALPVTASGSSVPSGATAGSGAAGPVGWVTSPASDQGSAPGDWQTRSSENASVTVRGPDAVDVRVFKCNEAYARKRLGQYDGRLRLSFDWAVESEGWYETPGVTVYEDGQQVFSDQSFPKEAYETTSGRFEETLQVDGRVEIRFSVTPSSQQLCDNQDHYNTTLRVRNLDATVEQSGDDEGGQQPDAPVERAFDNGTVYQTGEVVDAPDEIQAGETVRVTGEITAHHPAADGHIAYAVVGLADGTVLGRSIMGTGNGSVTVETSVPRDAAGSRLVWTFFDTRHGDGNGSKFANLAAEGTLTADGNGVVLGTVAEGTGGPVPAPAIDVQTAAGFRTVLNASVSVDVASYEWDFGDGATATGERVEHVYRSAGQYEVTLTVTGENGRTNSTTETVGVAGPWLGYDGQPAEFTVLGNRSANLTVGQCGYVSAENLAANVGTHEGPLTVAFDYEYALETDEQALEVSVSADGRGPFHVGSAGSGSGHFERTVRVDGDAGVDFVLNDRCLGTDERVSVEIRNLRVTAGEDGATGSGGPTAAFKTWETSAGTAITPDVEVKFDAAGSTADGSIASYEWEFGDGTTETGRLADHTYDTPGTYTVELTVTDEQGRVDTTQQTVEVVPSETDGDEDDGQDGDDTSGKPDLRAIAYGQTKSGYVDSGDPENETFLGGFRYEPVSFAGSSGDVVAIDAEPTGSGDIPVVRLWGPSGTLVADENLTRVRLPASGTYTVQIGFWASGDGYDLTLTRRNDEVPRAAVDYEPVDAVVNDDISFEAVVSDDGSVASYEWDFGDGTTADGETATHAFDRPGNHTVVLTVTDDEGLTDTATVVVDVESVLENRFDADDDGLELPELQKALRELTDGDPLDDVSVGRVRKLIDEYSGQSPSTGATDTDGDGLSDALEKRGIPVRNTYQLAGIGDDADLSAPLQDDPMTIRRLDTDPYDADTDGDGLLDGEELGAKKRTPPPESQPYYVLKSDPTDQNTDDAGIDDWEERNKSSDPTKPELVSIDIVLPVTAKEGCTPTSNGRVRNCAKLHEGGYILRPDAQDNEGDKPWVDNIDTDTDVHTYWLVKATVDLSSRNVPRSERPDWIRFLSLGRGAELVGQGPTKDAIEPGTSIDLDWSGDGHQTAYLVVETGNQFGWKALGTLEALVDIPPDSRIARGGSFEGTQRIATQSSLYLPKKIAFTSTAEARDMVREATKKWAQNTIGAVAPTGGALAKYKYGTGAKLIVEGYATLTGPGKSPSVGQDDLIAKAIVSEGAVPAYLEAGDEPPVTNVAIIFYREN